MANYSYVAIDPRGLEARGVLEVASQREAIRRVREMGLFPTKIKVNFEPPSRRRCAGEMPRVGRRQSFWSADRKIGAASLTVFTRQLATMIGAGMPLIRSLRILAEQNDSKPMTAVIISVASEIENGSSFSEALAAHPRAFNSLYINLVRAGEAGGALEAVLCRLTDFMEKGGRLRGKLKAAMVYPAAVILVAAGVMAVLLAFVVPKFQAVFEGLLGSASLPIFTQFVFGASSLIVHHLPALGLVLLLAVLMALGFSKVQSGRRFLDQLKLRMPLLGPLFRKAAISRFARTLGTLAGNGVPILQALTIVQETTGNLIVSLVLGRVHDQVMQGEAIAPVLRASKVFPPMVAGLVDVGEQTGSLPEMLMKIADTYDDEFDSAAKGLMSLVEPILIVALALLVGSIVIAMFLPLITIVTNLDSGPGRN
jgi:type IV pilus assembly protein PilC